MSGMLEEYRLQLFEAAEHGDIRFARAVLEALKREGNADVNLVDEESLTFDTPLTLAIQNDDDVMLELLMLAGASLTIADPSDGCLPIHVALRKPASRCVGAILRRFPTCAFATAEAGASALEMAIQYSGGDIENVAELLYWADQAAFTAPHPVMLDILSLKDEVVPPYLQALRFNYRRLAYALKYTPTLKMVDFSSPYVTAQTRTVILRALYIYAGKVTLPASLPCLHIRDASVRDDASTRVEADAPDEPFNMDPGLY